MRGRRPPFANAYVLAARRFTLPLRGVDFDVIYSLLILAVCAVYLSNAMRRVYGQSLRLTVLKCAALLFAAACILQLYRFVLFFTAYYSV